MALIRPFSTIRRSDASVVGGKGASLGELSAAGVPVPPGFVVTTAAFERFLEKADLTEEVDAQLCAMNIEDTKSVEEVSRVLHALFNAAAMPKDIGHTILTAYESLGRLPLVAVRSSATAEDSAAASWAGELETFLNTTRTTLLPNVKRCWASLFSPRALVYACDRGFLKKNLKFQALNPKQIQNSKSKDIVCDVKVAVVVQEMVQSEVAGVAFTVHPVTKDRDQMIIEAVWGLGEALVGGSVTPDSYVVHKQDRVLLDVHHADQEKQIVCTKSAEEANTWVPVAAIRRKRPKLNSAQILQLAELCMTIEKHYDLPCDIEWALASGKFWITQSRPITTL
jgi:pyruvate,water dikinase